MTQWKRNSIVVTLLSSLILTCGAFAQDLEELLAESEKEEDELRSQTQEVIGPEEEGMGARIRMPKGEDLETLRISQDRQIDPETYIVGPSDVLQLYIWGEFEQSVPFEVNPEGFVLIPTIGSFYVANRTLADIRREIITNAHRDKYPGVEITLDLTSMRFYTVYLTGSVATEGAVVVHPITRVADLIELGGGFSDDLRGGIESTVAGRKVTRASRVQSRPTARRSIRVTHHDGTFEEIDLMMFLATGDLKHNPYLRMGDRVHVPYRTEVVYIYGAVNEEGAKEYKRGDTVSDLMLLSAGQNGTAPLDQAELWRFESDGETTRVIPLMEPQSPESDTHYSVDDLDDVPLEADDMIFLRTRSEWNMSPNVSIHGQIRYRGRYRIYRGETRLLDVIEEAGGLSERASLKDAKLIRLKLKGITGPELQRLISLRGSGGKINPEERAYLKTKSREESGRLAVDFERLFEGDQSQNVLLVGGDAIFFPEERLTVNVTGQLLKPGLIVHKEGRTVTYYLAQAGGYSFRANKGGARLIRSRTGLREDLAMNAVVEPGDEIWVPENEWRDWWSLTTETAAAVAQTLTLIVLVRAF